MERWISARTTLVAPFDRAARILLQDAAGLIVDSSPRQGNRLIADLAVDVGHGSNVSQQIELSLGVPCAAEGEAWVPLSWRPTSHDHLLPSFDGVIEVIADDHADEAELAITGTYHVPLGVVGRFGDGIVGRRVAQQSLRSLIERMAMKLDAQVNEELLHTGWHPAPYATVLRDRPAPDTS